MRILGSTEAMVVGSGLQVKGWQSSAETHKGILLQQAGATGVDNLQVGCEKSHQL
jgi:hypothetical protein